MINNYERLLKHREKRTAQKEKQPLAIENQPSNGNATKSGNNNKDNKEKRAPLHMPKNKAVPSKDLTVLDSNAKLTGFSNPGTEVKIMGDTLLSNPSEASDLIFAEYSKRQLQLGGPGIAVNNMQILEQDPSVA